MKTAKEIIRQEYKESKNFMTPTVIRFGKINKHMAYELSSGRGIYDQPIYGVSVVSYDPDTDTTKREHDLSDVFQSLMDAEHYIKQLKRE